MVDDRNNIVTLGGVYFIVTEHYRAFFHLAGTAYLLPVGQLLAGSRELLANIFLGGITSSILKPNCYLRRCIH